MPPTSRRIDVIEAGTYRVRLIRNAIYVGVRFWHEADGWHVIVDGRTHRADGELLDPYEVWPWCQPVSEYEFEFMERRRRWAHEHQPDHPAANAFEPIDLSKLPPRF